MFFVFAYMYVCALMIDTLCYMSKRLMVWHTLIWYVILQLLSILSTEKLNLCVSNIQQHFSQFAFLSVNE